MSHAERTIVGIMEINDAKHLRARLEMIGIEIELGHNRQTCTKGCRVTVEVWADQQDLPAIRGVLEEERAKLLEDLDVDPALQEQVFDPHAESAICPACGTKFSTASKECPECGLVFLPDER